MDLRRKRYLKKLDTMYKGFEPRVFLSPIDGARHDSNKNIIKLSPELVSKDAMLDLPTLKHEYRHAGKTNRERLQKMKAKHIRYARGSRYIGMDTPTEEQPVQEHTTIYVKTDFKMKDIKGTEERYYRIDETNACSRVKLGQPDNHLDLKVGEAYLTRTKKIATALRLRLQKSANDSIDNESNKINIRTDDVRIVYWDDEQKFKVTLVPTANEIEGANGIQAMKVFVPFPVRPNRKEWGDVVMNELESGIDELQQVLNRNKEKVNYWTQQHLEQLEKLQ